jgi:hypothetical protein
MMYSLALVFTHSVLEDVVHELLDYICTVHPEALVNDIMGKTIDVREVETVGYAVCRQKLLKSALTRLRKASLPKKIEFLRC